MRKSKNGVVPALSSQPQLGELVRWYRNHRGWTQFELVLKLEGAMDQGQISRLENGTLKTPSLNALRKLGEVLEVPAGQLLKASRFPGAPILPPSFDEALVELPPERFGLVEHLVRFASGSVDLSSLSADDRQALTVFVADVQAQLAPAKPRA